MDNLTHTLFAATLARTRLARAGRGTTAALLLASNAPDIDVVSTAGGTMSYVHWHRGPTHGILGLVGLGIATAALVWAGYRIVDRRRPNPAPTASFGMLAAISILAVAFHILMDLPTSYGTRLLSPFDWHWYAFDWLPIIDIYLLAALAIGLVFGSMADARGGSRSRRAAPAASRARMATVVLVLMGVNYGLRATAHHQALERAPELFGRLLPPACNPQLPLAQEALAVWPSSRGSGLEVRGSGGEARGSGSRDSGIEPRQTAGPCLVEIAAMPTFLSPFRWRLIAHLSNAYELHDIDLLDSSANDDAAADRMWRLTLRYPDQWTTATMRAAEAPLASIFLGFSRFPSARTFRDQTGTTTVRWADMRFAGGITSLADRGRRPNPFNLVVRVDPQGRVIEQRAGQ